MPVQATNENSTPLTRERLLREFRSSERPTDRWLIGIEHEKIGVHSDGRPVAISGPRGVQALLQRFELEGFTTKREGGHIVGASGPRRLGGSEVTEKLSLEPGGQVEQAASPVRSTWEARQEVLNHLRQLNHFAQPWDIQFISGGFRPFGAFDDVEWLGKPRYGVMRNYLPTRGTLGVEMMKRTATMQMNFDFSDEANAFARFRSAMGVAPIVTAMAAASPLSEGKPNGFKSYRAKIWTDTDPDRCGVPAFSFSTENFYEDYADWVLDVPVFFIERDGDLVPANGLSFRRFMAEGLQRHTATAADWELHLSTVFPEVRLKHTLEVRGADAAPLPTAFGVAAVCRGIADDAEACAAAWNLVKDISISERLDAREPVARLALQAKLGRHTVQALAVELVAIARDGLSRLPGGGDDIALLEPLASNVREGRCPADQMLEDFAECKGQPEALVKRWLLRSE